MNARKLGRTQLLVSELGLTTGSFAWLNDGTTPYALLDTYYTRGGRFIHCVNHAPASDVAPVSDNDSEQIVGRWYQARRIPRDSLVVAVRFQFLRPEFGGSITFANHIRKHCEQSLRRLRMTHLDLLVVEWDDSLQPVGDVTESVDMLIRAGLVRYAVAGGFPPWRLVDSLHRASQRSHCRFEAIECPYSLLQRRPVETEILPLSRENRLGVLVRSPLAGGFLADRSDDGRDASAGTSAWLSERFGTHRGDRVRNELLKIAGQQKRPAAQVAVAWILREAQVASVLLNAESSAELDQLMAGHDIGVAESDAHAVSAAAAWPKRHLQLRHA